MLEDIRYGRDHHDPNFRHQHTKKSGRTSRKNSGICDINDLKN